MDEAQKHAHMAARGIYRDVDGVVQPGPAPRFSRTPSEIARPPVGAGADTEAVLSDWGIEAA